MKANEKQVITEIQTVQPGPLCPHLPVTPLWSHSELRISYVQTPRRAELIQVPCPTPGTILPSQEGHQALLEGTGTWLRKVAIMLDSNSAGSSELTTTPANCGKRWVGMSPGVSACWGWQAGHEPRCPGTLWGRGVWHSPDFMSIHPEARPTRCPAEGLNHDLQLDSTGTEPCMRTPQPCTVSKLLLLLSSDLISFVCQPSRQRPRGASLQVLPPKELTWVDLNKSYGTTVPTLGRPLWRR